MERRINFIAIGTIFLLILSALVVFIVVMGKFSFNEEKYKEYVIYTEHEVSGIGINTPVRYKGIAIGSISHISFDKDRLGVVKIVVRIKNKIPVRKDSTLRVDAQGLAGLNYLSLLQSKNPEFITSKKDAILNFEPNIFGKLTSKADEASQEVLLLIKSLKTLLSENNIESIGNTLKSADTLSENLKETQMSIQKLITNMNTLVGTLNKQVQNGDFNIRDMFNPFILRLNTSLNYMDQFFKRSNNVLDKFEKDPYNTIFGEQKK